MGQRIVVYPESPQKRKIKQTVDILKEGGVAIFPTDSVYAMGVAFSRKDAIERLCELKRIEPAKATFSIICSNFSQVSEYVSPMDKSTFRLLKRHLPGPFTFILPASAKIPRTFLNRRHTIGIRIPDDPVPIAIVEELGEPLITTSLYDEEDEIKGYMTDPVEIFERYGKIVEIVVDAGPRGTTPTTVVDLTGEEPVVVRQGAGELIL